MGTMVDELEVVHRYRRVSQEHLVVVARMKDGWDVPTMLADFSELLTELATENWLVVTVNWDGLSVMGGVARLPWAHLKRAIVVEEEDDE